MDVSQLTEQLRALYADTHLPALGGSEFTVTMFAEANGCPNGTAARLIEDALKSGRIRCVGERLHEKRKAKAYVFEPA